MFIRWLTVMEGNSQQFWMTANGQKDALGTAINDTSLRYRLGNYDDFINEESMLQYYGRMMGVLVDRMPKCHCKLAEGVLSIHGQQQKLNIKRFLLE
jgi:hypothetical protein